MYISVWDSLHDYDIKGDEDKFMVFVSQNCMNKIGIQTHYKPL